MAELYATMPLWALVIIRGYEVIFVPIVILYTIAGQNITREQRAFVLGALILSLPFMGVADSRGRILIIFITIIAFFPVSAFVRFTTRRIAGIVATILATIPLVYVSYARSGSYGSFSDYVQMQVYQRLDGLNIVTQLREAYFLSYWGEWDVQIFSPLISKIPFLEAAQAAKLAGRTSSKQYLLQDILRSGRLDESSSMINDPLYIGGIAGLVIAFCLLGILCAKFDEYILHDRFSRSFFRTALSMAFVISFVQFESDFIGAFAEMLQTCIVLFAMLFCGCRHYRVAEGNSYMMQSSPQSRFGWRVTAGHPSRKSEA